MANPKQRQNRRDRRKAKASNWAREGTTKPKRAGHHLYECRNSGLPFDRRFGNSRSVSKRRLQTLQLVQEEWKTAEELGLEAVNFWRKNIAFLVREGWIERRWSKEKEAWEYRRNPEKELN